MGDDECGRESTPHDNDADSRPRIYMKSADRDKTVEVTVEGSEGESTDDIADVADERFDHASDAAGESDDPDGYR